ncbi:hypothetical protein Pcinc_007447 [Petrolisthes cinctipes]|uniref:O-acyltransferase WSD1 C-terminal domain-containing protein n=1 Tax=Petrolisthes cinctipes TaxID=88211 RepID=A0AAE1G8J7_PETCI|nr:hypothetical protein Pcinc_007447 [Petrolisthes cinctipes]
MSVLWDRTSDFCYSVVGAVIVLTLGPVAGVVLMVLWLWRCLALLLVILRHRRWVTAASGMEALFALDSEAARAVISAAVILRGEVKVATVSKLVSERVLEARDAGGRYTHPKFRRVVEKRFGVVVWMEEENFDVSRHVRELRESGRPRVLADETDLVEVTGKRTNLPFVRGQARWEVLVAPLTSYHGGDVDYTGGYTVVLVRLHHSLGDGRSIVGVIMAALAEPPLVRPLPSPLARHHLGGRLARAGRLVWAVSNLPWVVARVLRRGDHSALHGPRLKGHKVLAWSVPLPLTGLKAGRPMAGVSVNDLLLAGLAQALHRYLESVNGEAPTRVMTVLPIDVTAPWDTLSLGNRISLCSLPLPTGDVTPLHRLWLVHKLLNEVKSSPDVLVNYLALDLISNLLPAPIARRVLNTHGVTMVASNLPGPPETIHLFGEIVEELMFWIPNKSRTGVGVSMLSYQGQVHLGINVDTALVPTQTQAKHLIDYAAVYTAQILLEAMKHKQEKQERNEEENFTLHEGKVVPEIITHRPNECEDTSPEDLHPAGIEHYGYYYSEDQLLLCQGELEMAVDRHYKRAHSDTNLQLCHMGTGQGRFALSDINIPLLYK